MDRSKDQHKVNAPSKDAIKDKSSCCTGQQKVSSTDPKKIHISAPAHDKK